MNAGRPAPGCARSGQAMIFVVMVLVLLAFVAFWQFDLHKTLYVKMRARDAADAAALAAARWQGQTLNLIGELNAIQAVLLTESWLEGEIDTAEAEALDDLRSRLSFVGPVMGLVAANQTAHNNRIYSNPYYTAQFTDHIARIREEYDRQFAPRWENGPGGHSALHEYAAMLEAIARQGLAVMPDNPSWFIDYMDRNHPLLNPAFYDAVASRNWCWFHFYQRALLERYTNWRSWPNLPALMQREPLNAEVFSLHLTRVRTAANWPALAPPHPGERIDEWLARAQAHGGGAVEPDVVWLDVAWHGYNPADWIPWTEFLAPGFPFATPVRPEYDVLGADAAVRIGAFADRITPGLGHGQILRTAAAKPFGRLADDDPIHAFGMVLPGFQDVRLIPMDASTAPEQGSMPGWTDHIYEHLPIYTQRGPGALPGGCYYCRQLGRWEDGEFRQSGRAWLEQYHHTCHTVTGPGPGPGGGTRRGH